MALRPAFTLMSSRHKAGIQGPQAQAFDALDPGTKPGVTAFVGETP